MCLNNDLQAIVRIERNLGQRKVAIVQMPLLQVDYLSYHKERLYTKT